MNRRPRRLRKNSIIRELVAETRLSKEMFIYPYFVVPGNGIKHPIDAMPGIHHFSVDELLKDVEAGLKVGVNKILLFGVGEEKTEDASSAYSDKSVVVNAVKALKEKQVKRIILTRPAVEAGENLGFLPGDMMEKLDPYM